MNFNALITPILVLIGSSTYAQWNSQSTPTQVPVEAIHFVSDNVGFIGSGYSVHKTTNGGSTWSSPTGYGGTFETELLANAIIRDFYFFDAQNGFMVGGGFYNAYDVVAKTTDGGVNWSLVYYAEGQGNIFRESMNSITFVNASIGFAVGGNGRVVKTTDGGSTWTDLNFSTTQNLRVVYFLDSQVGFIGGVDVLYKTTDGGTTWSLIDGTGYEINDIHLYDSNNGIASTEEGVLLQTSDGGETWTSETLLNFDFSLTDISFVGNVGYVLGNNASYQGYVIKTTDGGATWEQQTISNSYGLYALATTSANTVWAGGYSGKLFKTTNGGGPSKPIVSFSISATNFCENQNYTFENHGYEQYTYEWRVDGELKSTSYDFLTTLPYGSHTIELTAINGSQTNTKAVVKYVEADASFKEPLDISYVDGICTGSSTTIKVRELEWGDYDMYLNGVKVESHTESYPYHYFSTGALTNTTTFTVKVTRSNSCQDYEISKDVTVTVHPYPSSGSTLTVVQPDICQEGETAIQVADSRTNVKYELYYPGSTWNSIASVNGNGGNVLLNTPHLKDTTSFIVKGTVIGGACVRWFTDTLTVNVEKVTAVFQLSRVNTPAGEPITVYNTSFGATNFTWDFSEESDLKTSTEKYPGVVTFSGTGTHNISLQVSSSSGCSSTMERSITLYDNTTMDQSCWVTERTHTGEQYGESDKEFYNIETAPDGDVIEAGTYIQNFTFHSELLGKYEIKDKDVALFLARHSPEGVLKWVIPNVGGGGGIAQRLTVSPDGSIYLHVVSGEGNFFSADGSVFKHSQIDFYNPPGFHFIIKYSSEGLLQWARSFEQLEIPVEFQFTYAIDTDAQGNIYVANERVHKISPDGERLWSTDALLTQHEYDRGKFALAGDGSWYYLKGIVPLELSRYSKDGILEWTHEIAAPADYYNYPISHTGMGADNSGNLIFVLNGVWRTTWNQNELDPNADPSSFWIVKISPDGTVAWANKALSPLNCEDLEVSKNGTINLLFNSGGLASLQSQDGVPITMDFSGQTPYLVTYNTDGVAMRSRVIRDPAARPECVLFNVDLAAYNDDVYAVGLPNCGESIINGDIIDAGEVPSGVSTSYLAKFAMGCENTADKIEAWIIDTIANQYCSGSTIQVQYRMSGNYPIYDNNVYKVYLSDEYGFINKKHATLIGSLESTSPSGSIDVVIPESVVWGVQYYLRIVVDSDPELYSTVIPVNKNLLGSYTPDFDYFINDLKITMVPKAGPAIVDWLWVINEQDSISGDPNFIGLAEYIVPEAGNYSVCLTVTDECGTKRTICKEFYVQCDPLANLFYDYTVDQKTVTINTRINTERQNTFLWKFTDGATSTDQNPVHTFSAYGRHGAALWITNECGTNWQSSYIDLPCPEMNPSIASATSGKTVAFTTPAFSNVNAYFWTFGDGSTSSEQNPAHMYANEGTYTVSLKVTNDCESKTVSTSVVVICPGPVPSFTTTAQNLNIAFNNTSQNYSSAWWSFGDGMSSSEESPEHTYTSPGNYQVCLSASNECGTEQICKSVEISCPNPDVNFEYEVDGTGLQVTFTNVSSNYTSLMWSIDGAESTDESPSHTFESGVHEVCLSVENECGTESVCQNVVVVLTGRESELSNSISLYPNPIAGQLSISANQVKIDRVEVITALGMTVYSEVFNSPKDNIKINTEAWSHGEFLIILTIGTKKEVRKIVKR